ncbi:nuclear transport factor 2 family protein [Actinomadura rupiterrae]|uniref:nuclear transport factor 2 family protein n=1 Tax=Actinomadura rupiterrae TaxID=559627 RepID=UPI0020A30946|nr:nuclear transport factor 2 family protein [Actinomadura rupiterrae]MCP2334979.1 3-phenylpropionate/cinnamic acid dioxygenase small subunit [Actinomadura rupiterrae]
MPLTADDRTAITDLISMHGHLSDDGELDRMREVFAEDVVYDVSDAGFGVLHGVAGMKDAAERLGDGNPVGHHVTNVVLKEAGEDEVHARSKAIAIHADGRAGSAVYEDVVQRGPQGWRITRRTITLRRKPLGG